MFNVCSINAQERFFTFIEGWTSMAMIEYDEHYTVLGTGLNQYNANNLQFNEVSKSGQALNAWQISIPDGIGSDIGTQQSLSSYGNSKIVGVTIITEQGSLAKSKRVIFNRDFSQVLDSSWTYIPPQNEQSDLFITYQNQTNKILHGLHYYTGTKVNSVLLETDTLGNTIWEKSFACEGNCWMEPRHIIPAHDGGYIFTNTEQRRLFEGFSIDDHDVATIIKTDSLGVEQWRIRPGGLGLPYTSDYIILQPTDDGNYLCVWSDIFWRQHENPVTYNLNPDATMWFAKIAPDGTKIWEKNIQASIDRWDVDGSAYIMEQMIRTPDDNFVIITSNKLFKINQEAEIIWARNINPLNLEFSYEQIFYYKMKGISQTSDGGFIATGEFVAEPGTEFPEYIQTGFVLKLDEYGCYEADCHLEDPVSTVSPEAFTGRFSVYPNPAKDYITVEYDAVKKLESLSVVISDLNGRQVHHEKLTLQQAEVIISTDGLPAGQYFVTLHNNDEVLTTEKVILVE